MNNENIIKAAIIIGAYEFPNIKQFNKKNSFKNSANAIINYLKVKDPYGLNLDEKMILDLFNIDDIPSEMYDKISSFIKQNKNISDLFIYYVGHGLIGGGIYALACKTSKMNENSRYNWKSIQINFLADIFNDICFNTRIYFIIDCCYAGEAIKYFQGESATQHIQKISQKYFNEYGITLLVAASKYDAAFAPDNSEYTVFTNALLKILNTGIANYPTKLSLSQIFREIRVELKNIKAPLPELHTPIMKNGDPAIFPIFPNLKGTEDAVYNFSIIKKNEISIKQRPYKFLDYYTEADSDLFFGREKQSHIIKKYLVNNNFIILYGRSGVGKTSLIKAGLIPALKKNNFWVVYTRCGNIPEIAIKLSILRHWPESVITSQPHLNSSFSEFVNIAINIVKLKLIIIIDQFEEFFINLNQINREQFIKVMQECLKQNNSVFFILSIREDYIGYLDEFRPYLKNPFNKYLRLLNLDKKDAYKAIITPAEKIGIVYEPDALNKLINELIESSIDINTEEKEDKIYPPFLQIVCYRLFELIIDAKRNIELSDLNKLGGVKGLLENYLEASLSPLHPIEQKMARKLLKSLVSSQNTKIMLKEEDIADYIKIKDILNFLINQRIIRHIELDKNYYYELTHDKLIEPIIRWESIEEKQAKIVKELLRQSINNWKDHNLFIDAQALKIIEEQKHNKELELLPHEYDLLIISAIRNGHNFGFWLNQINELKENYKIESILKENLLINSQEIYNKTLNSLSTTINSNEINKKNKIHITKALLNFFNNVKNKMHKKKYANALWLIKSFLPLYIQFKILIFRFPNILKFTMYLIPGLIFSISVVLFIYFSPVFLYTKPDIQKIIIENGYSLMGSALGSEDEKPMHNIYLKTFYISKYEITIKEYTLFVNATRYHKPESVFFNKPEYNDYPITNITWYDAVRFCEWVGGRLPTEAEWEKAASWDYKNNTKYKWPWGNNWDSMKLNSFDSGINHLMRVGSYPEGSSPYGLLDMAGNVWEWTNSIYKLYPYDPNDGREDKTSIENRVVRGGSWAMVDVVSRTTTRTHFNPNYNDEQIGFRCVWEMKGE